VKANVFLGKFIDHASLRYLSTYVRARSLL